MRSCFLKLGGPAVAGVSAVVVASLFWFFGRQEKKITYSVGVDPAKQSVSFDYKVGTDCALLEYVY